MPEDMMAVAMAVVEVMELLEPMLVDMAVETVMVVVEVAEEEEAVEVTVVVEAEVEAAEDSVVEVSNFLLFRPFVHF